MVHSRPGEGATFTMYLPRVQADEVGPAEAGDNRVPLGEGARVLIVEDNAEVGAFATQALAELGYRTEWVTDGMKALAILADEHFDAVFSDVMMPGMSGIELGEKLAELYPNLPVLLTSGYSEVLARNADNRFALLHKPYSLDDLSRVLRKVAHIKHARA